MQSVVRSLALSTLLAAATCGAIAQTNDAQPASSAVSAAATDPDTFFKGRMGGTFGKNIIEVMPAGKRIAVAAFRVAFITDNSVTAQVRGAYLPGGIDMSGARSSLFVALKGVDPKTMQALTDKAYEDLLAQLAASGREVVPLDPLKDMIGELKASKPGYTKEQNGQTAAFFSPTGLPLVFTHFEGAWGDGGMLDLHNYRKLQEISGKHNTVVIAPMLFVNFAKMRSSGNQSGLVARAAETGAELGMSVAALNSYYVRTTEFRNGMHMQGDEGNFSLAQAVTSAMQFGTLKETASEDNTAVKTAFDVLGKLAGMQNAGGASRSSKKAVAESTDEAYAAAARDVLQRTNGLLAQWFRKYPPAN
ncbi:hypothetical protein [Ramlibacter albus]|uniref:Uncharacterized protein n=1 Tax=Ramlibacter albus TaxID=2079448 RepID=A0A923MEU8_9BURK|nr:hypothetical protein [Ramlibacter albus]MBC5767984.1 hypothetical protein [Ramlibacter albus]